MDWAKFRKLVAETVLKLKAADRDWERIEVALRKYIEGGEKYGMSPLILWDYFAISSPGIAEQAGYCGYDQERIVALFDRLTMERFG